jgi:cytochrome c oxidase subunit 1
MTAVAGHEPDTQYGHGAPARRSRLMRPGWLRAAWCTAAFFLIGMYIVVALRWLAGWEPIYDWTIIVLVGALVCAPIGFLLGLGAFDYWLHYLSGRPTQPEDHSGHGATSWKDYFRVNTDHKVIGVQYTVTVFVMLIVGGLMAMLFRAELAEPGLQFMDGQTFNGLVSMHATLLIFTFMVPVFAGLGNYVIPIMIGAPDMAFPRLNALSYWLLPIAGVMFLASFLAPGGAFAAGWTGYAPLASDQPVGSMFFNMGVQWAGASSILTALNFLVTIITMRAPGMTFWRMPLLVWANFTTSLLVVLATPFIAGSQFFVMFDRVMHTSFFVPEGGGYALGYQHIFWFYSHPAVYIMILPGFGIISEVISVFSRKPIFGYRLMAISLVGILVLGFSVWAHHLFVAGMADWLRVPMMISTLLIAVPTGVKVFSWLATMWQGRIHLTTPMLFALGFISTFVIGGLSGIYLGSVAIDIHASDTYFVVAHIHYVFFGGSLLTVFAGVYYWFPKMTGRMYNETLGKLHFWLTFVFLNLTFFPMHWVGLRGMPRRVSDYAEEFAGTNLFITIASFALGASVFVFFYNMVVSWARGPAAGANPWRSLTLEWQVSSPPPVFNFDEVPTVVGGPYEYGVPGAKHAVLKSGAGALQEAHV